MTVSRIMGLVFAQSHKPTKFQANRRKARLGCELFEDRVVLSHMGGFPGGGGGFGHEGHGWGSQQVGSMVPRTQSADVIGSLGSLGVLPIGGGMFGHSEIGESHGTPPSAGTDPTSVLFANLKTASDKLRTDVQSLAAKSGLTVADMSSLFSDSKTIAATGATLDKTALDKAVSSIAYAVAGGTDPTQAKADFAAVFTGTTVTQPTIDKTTTDLVQAITDSKVTTTDLDLVTADKTAIDAARKALTDAGFGQGGCPANPAPVTTPVTTPVATPVVVSSSASTPTTSASNAAVTQGSSLHGASRVLTHVVRSGHHR
ncbi:MAG: hypothetical protein NT172_21220 [Planctomycetota bacterium]|nr:hypothetical protein [Planctomycetota bacterium]